MNHLTQILFSFSEEFYKNFHSKLVPDCKHNLIGVRVPIIKNIAKQSLKTNREVIFDFISETHTFYEEFMLHALLINSLSNDINIVIKHVEDFLPQIDNWAVCDSFCSSLKIFKKHPELVLSKVKKYIESPHDYTKRFAIVTLINYYLDNNFNEEILRLVCAINSENYYVNMAIAWLFSVALVKQYDSTISYFINKSLPHFIHNKAIQKAIESYRITDKQKDYLKSLKQK